MKKVLEKAIETYGINAQLDVCVEEMSELIKEICKKKRGQNNREAIIEEIADVTIMLQQLEMMCDIKPQEVFDVVEIKVKRLKEILENGKKR